MSGLWVPSMRSGASTFASASVPISSAATQDVPANVPLAPAPSTALVTQKATVTQKAPAEAKASITASLASASTTQDSAMSVKPNVREHKAYEHDGKSEADQHEFNIIHVFDGLVGVAMTQPDLDAAITNAESLFGPINAALIALHAVDKRCHVIPAFTRARVFQYAMNVLTKEANVAKTWEPHKKHMVGSEVIKILFGISS